MTPEERAKELYESMYYETPSVLSEKRKDETGKACAAICCMEIINVLQANKERPTGKDYYSEQITYWQQVKEAINSL